MKVFLSFFTFLVIYTFPGKLFVFKPFLFSTHVSEKLSRKKTKKSKSINISQKSTNSKKNPNATKPFISFHSTGAALIHNQIYTYFPTKSELKISPCNFNFSEQATQSSRALKRSKFARIFTSWPFSKCCFFNARLIPVINTFSTSRFYAKISL